MFHPPSAQYRRARKKKIPFSPFVLLGRMVGLHDKELPETWDHGEHESIIAKAARP